MKPGESEEIEIQTGSTQKAADGSLFITLGTEDDIRHQDRAKVTVGVIGQKSQTAQIELGHVAYYDCGQAGTFEIRLLTRYGQGARLLLTRLQ